ncbi:ACT domain-containing protein [bacterium]|nr:ACT domain-containing protein [bacterium]
MHRTDQHKPQEAKTVNTAILRLTVNNHPGVMLQICGPFARRIFNLEGIFCTAIDQGETSCIWLKVDETEKLDQVVKQLAKLEDVLAVEERDDARERINEMEAMMARIG